MRALLIVLDHLGVGHVPEGHGAPVPDPLSQLFTQLPDLELPTLFSLGLGEIIKGRVFDPPARRCTASYGRMIQRSAGADSLSGLWELAGAISGCPFSAFEQIPVELTAAIALKAGVPFLISSPCETDPSEFEKLREGHLKTGSPILSLSPDSTLHISVHESIVPTARLAQICRIARQHCDTWRIAHVIGQSFTGNPDGWKPDREAFHLAMVPPRTILNAVSDRGLPVEAVGAINGAFARSGITLAHPTKTRADTLHTIERLWKSPQNGVIFANVGDLAYDSGTPTAGFARALEKFDSWLAGFLDEVEPDNLLIITGSQDGNPAAFSPCHPRQEIPVLVHYGGHTGPLGIRETLADVAATLGAFFGIDEHHRPWSAGEPLITFHRPRGFNGP